MNFNDAAINSVINNLCDKFNVATSELIPRMQAYKMAMAKLGMWISGGFMVLLLAGLIAYICYLNYERNNGGLVCSDDYPFAVFIWSLANIVPVIALVVNAVEYVGWKYAPEIKMFEYITHMIK